MLTILGSGHAGITLAREWRKLNPDAPLRILTRDDGHYYYKPDLSKAFASGKDAEGLIKNRLEELQTQIKAEILSGVTVTRVDAAAHRLFIGKQAYSYSKLVLATGAEVIRLSIAGDAAGRVLHVNDRLDYARFRAALAPGARVLLIGAGLIGCEFANDLAAAGYTVRVADLARWPLPRLLPETLGRALQAGLEKMGVQFHLERSVKSLNADGAALRAELSGGETLLADVVLSAVGLRANTALARQAGARCEAGLVVDAQLQSSLPDIYALGDCIQIAGRVHPYILPIAHAARALAQTLNGAPTKAKFPAMPVLVKTPACPTVISPPASAEGAWEISGSAPDLQAVFKDEAGKPLGFALTGTATAQRSALAAQMPAVFDPQ